MSVRAAPLETVRNRRLASVALYLAALMLAVAGLAQLGLTLNVTASMPVGLYRLQRVSGPIPRGATVQVCAPDGIARLGAQRGYLPAGGCASGRAPLLKIVVAVPGDVVVVGERATTVNGRPLVPSSRARRDGRGRRLPAIPAGRYVLGPDELWLWTPYALSWDSRYFGPVPRRNVRGVAHLLLAFPPLLAGPAS